MKYIMYSRKLKRDVEFSLHGHYVYVDLNDLEGTLGNQICDGGYLTGNTISCSEKEFTHTCKTWWKLYLRRIIWN